MTRREQLESMLADSPEDTFLRYALAMELESEGENERSLSLHQGLIADEPPYVPSFFMSGQQLADLDRTDEAIEILRQGIEQAGLQGDDHAKAEMISFLQSLE
ncbi:MAG: hypothetical protein ACPIA2_04910 [Mariniblastus sp.]